MMRQAWQASPPGLPVPVITLLLLAPARTHLGTCADVLTFWCAVQRYAEMVALCPPLPSAYLDKAVHGLRQQLEHYGQLMANLEQVGRTAWGCGGMLCWCACMHG